MFAAIRLLIGRGNRLLRHPSSPHTPGARLVAFRSAPRASCSSFSSSSTCPFPTPRSARRPLLPPGFPGVGPDAPCGSAAPLASSRAAATSPYDPYRHAPAAGPGLRSSTATSGWLPRSAHGTAAGVARRPSPPPPRPANATAPPRHNSITGIPFPHPGATFQANGYARPAQVVAAVASTRGVHGHALRPRSDAGEHPTTLGYARC